MAGKLRFRSGFPALIGDGEFPQFWIIRSKRDWYFGSCIIKDVASIRFGFKIGEMRRNGGEDEAGDKNSQR